MDLFRICPGCGRRFHVKLVGEELVDDERHTEEIKRALLSPAGIQTQSIRYTVVEEDLPVEIDVKEFQYTYKCKKCGHMWAEMHEKESKSD